MERKGSLRAGPPIRVAREVSKCKFHLVGAEEV